MKRFLRILLDAATVLLLVLCAATIVLWVRSYWVYDMLGRIVDKPGGRGHRDIRIVSADGVLGLQYTDVLTSTA